MRTRTTLALALLLGAAPAAAVTLDLDAPGRTETDKDRDTYNKPKELLEFWGIREGMAVMDLFPGGGYLTQLLGQAVGPRGKVLGYASYSHDKFDERVKKGALKNVEEMVLEYPKGFEELDTHLAKLPAASFDAILTIRNYHDLKNPKPVLAELKRVLKPGGILGIVDSRTYSGKRDESVCRIGEDLVINEVLEAGFKLTGVSSMFSNPRDDYGKAYWDARWMVDQSCLKFVR
ncbi:MAG: methyltransferase domain-containing protein [Candidatus Polarisedimenticolia bacterium]